jgi:glycosyltransferase involved in cell wall biosynthesis
VKQLVFIPAWNEEDSIGDVILGLRSKIPGIDILVVNDGSKDSTAKRARAAGAMVATHSTNLGLGASLKTGYLYALRHNYECVAHCDADGQHTPESVEQLLSAISAGECDLAIGSRFLEAQASDDPRAYVPSTMRRMGISVFRAMVSRSTKQRFTDCTSGLRAGNASTIFLFAERYGSDYPELESLVRAARSGLRIREYPVVMRYRAAGSSKITPWKTFFWVFNGVVSLGAASLRARQEIGDHVV